MLVLLAGLAASAPLAETSAGAIDCQRHPCACLSRFEPSAMLGKLTDEQRATVETCVADPSPRRQDKASRILMADATARRDGDRLAALMRRHLYEIADDDPDLTYRYARHLGRDSTGASAAEGLRWADRTLEVAGVWADSGSFGKKLYLVHALRVRHATAVASQTSDPGRLRQAVRDWARFATPHPELGEGWKEPCEQAWGSVQACLGEEASP